MERLSLSRSNPVTKLSSHLSVQISQMKKKVGGNQKCHLAIANILQRDDFKDAKNDFNDEQLLPLSKPAKALAVFQHAVTRVVVIYR